MPLSHRQIEVFRAVMRAGQVTGAAVALHTSQPTLSRELARMEQLLGVALFDRVRGRLRPTAPALALLDEIERAYVGLERVSALAASLKSYGGARLQLACLPALTHALLPAALRVLAETHPDAQVSMTPLESPLLEQWLSEQRFDLGLIEHDQAPAGTQATPLFDAHEVAVLPAGDPLLAKARLTLADFAGRRFISLAAQDAYRQQIDALFSAAGVQRQLGLDTASAVSVCALVAQGLGVAIVNPLTALAMESPALHLRPLAVPIRFQVSLVRPDLRPSSPLQDALEAALRAVLASMSARLAR